MLVLDSDVTLCVCRCSNKLLTIQLLQTFQTLLGVCYEESLFERVSHGTAQALHQEGYAAHVRDGLKQGAYALRSSTDLPFFANNFTPPAVLCCGRHSLQGWGIMRRTPLFRWAKSHGAVWLVEWLHAALREVEYRKGDSLPISLWRSAHLMRGYVQLLNHPEVPTWYPVTCAKKEVETFFGDKLKQAQSLQLKVPLDRLSPASAVALSQHLHSRMEDGWLVYTNTRPPQYLQHEREWYCLPQGQGKALYYCHLTAAPTWCYSSYWVDSCVCPSTLTVLTV